MFQKSILEFRQSLLNKSKEDQAFLYSCLKNFENLAEQVQLEVQNLEQNLGRGFNQNSRAITSLYTRVDENIASLTSSLNEHKLWQENMQARGQEHIESALQTLSNGAQHQNDRLKRIEEDIQHLKKSMLINYGMLKRICKKIDPSNETQSLIEIDPLTETNSFNEMDSMNETSRLDEADRLNGTDRLIEGNSFNDCLNEVKTMGKTDPPNDHGPSNKTDPSNIMVPSYRTDASNEMDASNETNTNFSLEMSASTVIVSPPPEVLESDSRMLSRMPFSPTQENIDMDRKSICTVPILYDKWYVSREPVYSFALREKKWGSSWLLSDKHFHNRMKKLIKIIERGSKMISKSEGLTQEDLAKLLDEYRKKECLTVHKLSERRKDTVLEGLQDFLQQKGIRFR